jgi:hypothetical protein
MHHPHAFALVEAAFKPGSSLGTNETSTLIALFLVFVLALASA